MCVYVRLVFGLVIYWSP